MIAQAVAEYGLMQQMALGVQKVSFTVQSFISDAGPGTWTVVAAIVVYGLWNVSRRRSG